jgi:hypothetical protein
LHPLLHAGLSRRTVNYFSRATRPGILIVADHRTRVLTSITVLKKNNLV